MKGLNELSSRSFSVVFLFYFGVQCFWSSSVSPQTGFEPVTNRLTADRSTTELLRIRRINATKVSFICLLLHRHGINNDAFMLEIYHIARFLSMGSLVICLNKVTCISILNLLYYM